MSNRTVATSNLGEARVAAGAAGAAGVIVPSQRTPQEPSLISRVSNYIRTHFPYLMLVLSTAVATAYCTNPWVGLVIVVLSIGRDMMWAERERHIASWEPRPPSSFTPAAQSLAVSAASYVRAVADLKNIPVSDLIPQLTTALDQNDVATVKALLDVGFVSFEWNKTLIQILGARIKPFETMLDSVSFERIKPPIQTLLEERISLSQTESSNEVAPQTIPEGLCLLLAKIEALEELRYKTRGYRSAGNSEYESLTKQLSGSGSLRSLSRNARSKKFETSNRAEYQTAFLENQSLPVEALRAKLVQKTDRTDYSPNKKEALTPIEIQALIEQRGQDLQHTDFFFACHQILSMYHSSHSDEILCSMLTVWTQKHPDFCQEQTLLVSLFSKAVGEHLTNSSKLLESLNLDPKLKTLFAEIRDPRRNTVYDQSSNDDNHASETNRLTRLNLNNVFEGHPVSVNFRSLERALFPHTEDGTEISADLRKSFQVPFYTLLPAQLIVRNLFDSENDALASEIAAEICKQLPLFFETALLAGSIYLEVVPPILKLSADLPQTFAAIVSSVKTLNPLARLILAQNIDSVKSSEDKVRALLQTTNAATAAVAMSASTATTSVAAGGARGDDSTDHKS